MWVKTTFHIFYIFVILLFLFYRYADKYINENELKIHIWLPMTFYRHYL